MKNSQISVQGTIVSIKQQDKSDFISLTDIARAKNPNEPKDVVKNWMRSRTTIEFLGLWERINNPDFKGVEFDSFSEATLNFECWILNSKAKAVSHRVRRVTQRKMKSGKRKRGHRC